MPKFQPITRWSDGRFYTADTRPRIAKLLRAWRKRRDVFIVERLNFERGRTYGIALREGSSPVFLVQTKG